MVCHVISSCPICPQVRLLTKPRGHLAPREAPLAPWREVHVDCIGPWTVTINDIKLCFEALTCIDPITNLVDISCFQGRQWSRTHRPRFPIPFGLCGHHSRPDHPLYTHRQLGH